MRKIASKKFKEKYLKNFHLCNGYEDLKRVGSLYNAVLIGSDQMWPAGIAFGNFISMRFVPNGVRKISYATSCGVTSYPKYCYKSSAEMWRSFDFLSTREEQGKKLIKRICGDDIKVEVLVDPTYLLSKKEWEERIPVKKMLDENKTIPIRDLVERFVGIDKEFHGEPWNIRQILTNMDMIIPVEDRN